MKMQFDYSQVIKLVSDDIASEISPGVSRRADIWAPICESPIELILILGVEYFVNFLSWQGADVALIGAQQKDLENAAKMDNFIAVVPQYIWNDMRIDFAFFVSPFQKPCLFVECDGHDFHERTPDQAARDRSRDRVMQEAGTPIFRFTGREIHRGPLACAIQIFETLWRARNGWKMKRIIAAEKSEDVTP